MKQIRAIYSDNEGCILPGKGLPFPLEDLVKLQAFLKKHASIGFGLCTGRSVPYVEAMVQALDIINSTVPSICEGGPVLYWPAQDTWESIATSEIDRSLILQVVSGLNFREEPGKVVCFSLYPNAPATVDALYDTISKTELVSQFHVTKSVAAVDITPVGIDKRYGLQEVCNRTGIDLSEVLYIGDAKNDLNTLQAVGFSACPNNASDEVKDVVDFVASQDSALGVLEILNHFEPYFCQ